MDLFLDHTSLGLCSPGFRPPDASVLNCWAQTRGKAPAFFQAFNHPSICHLDSTPNPQVKANS